MLARPRCLSTSNISYLLCVFQLKFFYKSAYLHVRLYYTHTQASNGRLNCASVQLNGNIFVETNSIGSVPKHLDRSG